MSHLDRQRDLAPHRLSPLSRRRTLRLLGGLGLAAAVPVLPIAGPVLAAETSLVAPLLQIAVSQPPVLEQRRGRFENPFTPKATITVTATIVFTADDLRAMRKGKTFRLDCQIWENDNDNQAPEPAFDQFVFNLPPKTFPRRPNNLPDKTTEVKFQTTVERSALDLDTPNPNGDEIVALLILTRPNGQQISRATNLVKLCPCQP